MFTELAPPLLHQRHTALHQQIPQIPLAHLRDAAQALTPASAVFLRRQADLGCDLGRHPLELLELHRQHVRDQLGQRFRGRQGAVGEGVTDLVQRREAAPADDAELQQMAANRVDGLRALLHEQGSGPIHGGTCLRRAGLDRHIPRRGAAGRFDHRSRIVGVVLLPLHERLDLVGGNQLDVMTEGTNGATPVV